MPNFDYITDDRFRQALQRDWEELEAVYAAKAWKAVHVLAGSIIEAAMIDYLEAAPLPKPPPDLTGMRFVDLVKLCRSSNIISARNADLSSVVRDYRNLIHPGRLIRTGEQVTKDSATVARSLVELLVDELATGKRNFQGYTAKQLLAKLLDDHTSLALLPHLLNDMAANERKRLVRTIIPDTYMHMVSPMTDEPPDARSLDALKRCHRMVLNSADNETKQLAAQKYVSILKSQSSDYLEPYELAFFRGSDLQHVKNSEQPLVKTRLLDRLKVAPSVERLATLDGLFLQLTEKEAYEFAYQLLNCIANDKPTGISGAASKLLISECAFLIPPVEDKVKECIRLWDKHAEDKQLAQVKRRLADVRASILAEPTTAEDDIPF